MRLRDYIVNTALAIAVSVPIIIGKVNADREPKLYEGPKANDFDVAELETKAIEKVESIEPEIIEITEPVFEPYEHVPLSSQLQIQINVLCEHYHIAYDLALAIIKTESDFQVDISGDNGNAIGLCQIWPQWWSDTAAQYDLDIYEPIDNVELMLIIMQSNLEMCEGDLTKALQMYNTGTPDGSEYADRVYENLYLIERR